MGLTLTGCGQKTKSASQNIVEIEYAWWGNDNRHTYTMDGVDEFMVDNPEINVNYRYGEWSGFERKNNIWTESNTQADVMQINYAWLDTYSKDGNGYYDLYQLADYIDLSAFDETDLLFGEVDGKLNAIPIAYNTSTYICNKDMFDAYGLEVPKTWDDLIAASAKMSKDNKYVIGTSKKHLILMLIAYYEQTTGKHAFDETGKCLLDKEGIGIMLDFYKKLIDTKTLMPLEQYDREHFARGECASSVLWISDADNYCQALVDEGFTPIISSYPMAQDAKQSGIYMKPATMYAISSITEHPMEAAMLLDFLLNSEKMALLQNTEKGVPVSKKAIETLKEHDQVEGFGYEAYEEMNRIKDTINVMIPVMENDDMNNVFKDNADAYLYDVATREETINKIYAELGAYR